MLPSKLMENITNNNMNDLKNVNNCGHFEKTCTAPLILNSLEH